MLDLLRSGTGEGQWSAALSAYAVVFPTLMGIQRPLWMPQEANAGSKMQAAFPVMFNTSVNQEVFFPGEEGGSFV